MSHRDSLEGAIEALEAHAKVFLPITCTEEHWAYKQAYLSADKLRAQLAALPPEEDGWMPIATMTEADAEKGVLRPHYAWGTMSVKRNRHSFLPFGWMPVDESQNAWCEESFLPVWRPLPAPPKGTP